MLRWFTLAAVLLAPAMLRVGWHLGWWCPDWREAADVRAGGSLASARPLR
jgi:hypothetical protein